MSEEMSNTNELDMILPPLGVTFYCPTDEDFKKVSAIRQRLEGAGIPSMWSISKYDSKNVTALNVYANANEVAKYLRG